MDRISRSTKSIIEKLGYINSNNFYYYTELMNCKELSFYDRKVLKELSPSAFFVVDGRPKVLFFDYTNVTDSEQELYKKIWNYQVPIVIFNDYNSIKVFNGNTMELSDIDNLKLNKIVEESIDECNEFSPFSYWNVTNEEFLRKYNDYFSNITLNEVMIENMNCITRKLKEKYQIKFATKLILRIIFIRFLIDRKINIGYKNFCGDVSKDQNYLLEISKKKDALYDLFEYLKEKFNGNLFELGAERESLELEVGVFKLLESFISGCEEMESGQRSLLPLYDFNIIPIELISNIYEILLGSEAQQKDKAFYTPEYLVDYIVKETVGAHLLTEKQCKVLDPSCGSGVFLVETLRCILNNNADDSGYIKENNKLIELVENNIYGVDLNPEAIDITIFSLYLTLFDYKDPKSLEGFRLPNLKHKNLFVSDFFQDENLESLKEIDFDYILGNPPWGSIKSGLHMDFCKVNNIKNQNNEISRSFIAKVKDYSSNNTICTLVIPSKIFYNQQKPAVEFRKKLLRESKILKFIEMSSVRNLIFKNANAPAAVFMYQYSKDDCLKHNMLHISLKPNMFFKLYQIIATEKNDIKRIRQEVLYENDWAWKTCVYGTIWDIENIAMLKKKHKSLDTIVKENDLKTAAGISGNAGEKDASCFKGRYIIDAQSINTFYYKANKKEKFTKDKIYRLGKPEVYHPPYCLMRKGTDVQSYRIRSAYVEDDVIFEQALSAIKGNDNQKELLLNISGVLNSSLYIYFNLMLGSSIGIEREQIFMNEVYKYPFVYDPKIGEMTREIQNKSSNLQNISEEINRLDEQIFETVGLENDVFVDYALNVQIPMINNKKWTTYKKATVEDLVAYSELFKQYWKTLMEQQGKNIQITLYKDIMNKFNVFKMNILDFEPENELIIENKVNRNKKLLSRFMVDKINDQFYEIRDVVYFEQSSFYIIKTNEAKNWHKAMGYIDNTSVIESILSNGKGE